MDKYGVVLGCCITVPTIMDKYGVVLGCCITVPTIMDKYGSFTAVKVPFVTTVRKCTVNESVLIDLMVYFQVQHYWDILIQLIILSNNKSI